MGGDLHVVAERSHAVGHQQLPDHQQALRGGVCHQVDVVYLRPLRWVHPLGRRGRHRKVGVLGRTDVQRVGQAVLRGARDDSWGTSCAEPSLNLTLNP